MVLILRQWRNRDASLLILKNAYINNQLLIAIKTGIVNSTTVLYDLIHVFFR